jgi:hypothetical protein
MTSRRQGRPRTSVAIRQPRARELERRLRRDGHGISVARLGASGVTACATPVLGAIGVHLLVPGSWIDVTRHLPPELMPWSQGGLFDVMWGVTWCAIALGCAWTTWRWARSETVEIELTPPPLG